MTKDELLAKIDASWTAYRTQVESYDRSVVELEAHDGWSVKDHVAHIAAWEQNLLGLFAGEFRLAAMGVPEIKPGTGFDEINAAVRLLHHDKSYEVVDAFSRDTHAAIVARLEALSMEDLNRPYAHYQPDAPAGPNSNDPVYGWVNGITFEHYAEHRPWIASLVEEVTATHAR